MKAFHVESFYGYVDNDFSYDDISCAGDESTLDSCQHNNLENCYPNEGAGVVCIGGDVSSTTETTRESKFDNSLMGSPDLH